MCATSNRSKAAPVISGRRHCPAAGSRKASQSGRRQGRILAGQCPSCHFDLAAVRSRRPAAERDRQPVPEGRLPGQRAVGPGGQHLVRVWLSRRRAAHAGLVGSPWRQGDVAHDRRSGQAQPGSGARHRRSRPRSGRPRSCAGGRERSPPLKVRARGLGWTQCPCQRAQRLISAG